MKTLCYLLLLANFWVMCFCNKGPGYGVTHDYSLMGKRVRNGSKGNTERIYRKTLFKVKLEKPPLLVVKAYVDNFQKRILKKKRLH
ncbi:hypothetical protein MTO96_046348 [Rhipicephalus appendiculatus]